MTIRAIALLLILTAAGSNICRAENWPQFRGPRGAAISPSSSKLPAEVGPDKNVVWKTELPSGHSSPVVFGDRVFVTGVKDNRLLTIGLDRNSGKVLWEAEAPHDKLENIHNVGSYAQSSPAADGERVVSFFGSSGLYCYDPDGKLLWKRPMGPFKNDFGAGSSPLIVDDRVILCQDHDTDSFLAAFDKRTGKTIWQTDRSEFPRNYATPAIWEVEGKKQIVVCATLRIIGYDFETGKELWTVHGVARIINMTPIIGDDGILYAACWSPGGDENDRIQPPTFDELIAKDKNGNGSLEPDDLGEGPIKQRFTQIDRDKTGHITRTEYETMRKVFETARNVVLAIRPGGKGDITNTHVLWQYDKQLPYCPSPVYHDGRIFMVKDGGIVSCLDASTGKPTKQGRISATGSYFSSPVGGDGKLYMLSQRGKLTVISDSAEWEELGSADFGEDAYSTPAIADGRLFVRTNGHLYCFGLPETSE